MTQVKKTEKNRGQLQNFLPTCHGCSLRGAELELWAGVVGGKCEWALRRGSFGLVLRAKAAGGSSGLN